MPIESVQESAVTDLAFNAMVFARQVHSQQVRKYTGNPYADHLAEVAGIVAAVGGTPEQIAASWLHDCVEDQGVTQEALLARFGPTVTKAVMLLSDLEQGNRKTRKHLSRLRLAAAPGWVQTVKVADLISNTSTIVKHDPHFAVVYLREKRQLLDVMTEADPRLVELARQQT
jgi:guanosine-3',5'-bis(diphosphate) 3'-pyrophosphohydrolase